MRNDFLMKVVWLLFLLSVFTGGCSPSNASAPSELPMKKGSTWVYAYDAYEQSADPDHILKATYELTETIVDVETVSSYVVAHVTRDYKLIDADTGWMWELNSAPDEFWYLVKDHQVWQSNQPLDDTNIQVDQLILDYDFPLSPAKTWCLATFNPEAPKGVACEFVGRREVTSQGPYESPAGKFDECYDMIDYWNTGNFFYTFCGGVGIVSIKFDHPGTRFGFEQTLLSYSVGAP